jgi:hypothetical protein
MVGNWIISPQFQLTRRQKLSRRRFFRAVEFSPRCSNPAQISPPTVCGGLLYEDGHPEFTLLNFLRAFQKPLLRELGLLAHWSWETA